MLRFDRLRRARLKARLALLWEQAAMPLMGPALVIGLYLSLALYGVFERLGDPWRLITLVLMVGGAAAWLRWRWSDWSWPSMIEIERRIEDDSGLKDRPFEALRDLPASGDQALWAAHAARMQARLNQAKARRPKAAWAQLDPWGMRVNLVLVTLVGMVLAGDLAWVRLSDALAPRLMVGGGQDARMDLWIEPPAYTNQPTLFLRDRRDAQVPEGSVLMARISGFNHPPRVSGATAETETLSEGVQMVRIVPEQSGTISLRAGVMREQVNLDLLEDQPPRLTFAATPESDAQGLLSVEYVAEDDYGLEGLILEYAAAPETGETLSDDAFESYVFSPGDIAEPDADGLRTAVIDLSRSPLAGQRAVIRLVGFDGAGQRGVSGEMALTLPQRVFLDPLARAVADERRRFMAVDQAYATMPDGPASPAPFLDDQPSRRLDRAPADVQRLAEALNAVSDAPALYFDDVVVYTGLRTALHEVRRAREREALSHLDEDLWQIALRAELGSLADAEAALRAAERALADALARDADPVELSSLFDAFERAMDNYMQALAREAAREGRFAEGGGGGGMNSDMLEELLQALREAAELGDTEGSRRALAQLAELLRNMQVQLGSGNGEGQGESAMAQALREALEELSDAINEQRGLMEDTFNAERNAQQNGTQSGPGDETTSPTDDAQASGPQSGDVDDSLESFQQQDGAEGLQALADPQAELSDRLDEISGGLPDGETSDDALDALQAAQDAMEDAARALGEGQGEQALSDQDGALSSLRQAAQAAAEALERELSQEGDGQDPLGRNGSGEGDTDLPSEAERQRARDILEELRRRAAERNRPQEELDYIDRLLERF